MHNHKKNFFLNEIFPGQFDTIPHIIIWTLVFIADAALVIWVCWLLGFTPLNMRNSQLLALIYLIITFVLFCLESFLYNLIKR